MYQNEVPLDWQRLLYQCQAPIGSQCYVGLLIDAAIGWQTDIFLTDATAEAVPPSVVIPVDLTASEKAPDNVTTALLDTGFVASPRRYPTSEFTQFWIVLKRTLLFSRRDWVRQCQILCNGSNWSSVHLNIWLASFYAIYYICRKGMCNENKRP
jgi:hypothetical protein